MGIAERILNPSTFHVTDTTPIDKTVWVMELAIPVKTMAEGRAELASWKGVDGFLGGRIELPSTGTPTVYVYGVDNGELADGETYSEGWNRIRVHKKIYDRIVAPG